MKTYRVHWAAAVFPLLNPDSEDFKELAGSILEKGVLDPLVVDGDLLLDGRNRLAACELLKIEAPVVEWASLNVPAHISQAAWILDRNLARRHLREDQRVMIITEFNRGWIEQEAAAAKKNANPAGNNQHQGGLDLKSGPDLRDVQTKHARSTPGRIAELAHTSRYKAEQAVAVSRAAERGEIDPGTVEAVKAGKVPLCAAAVTVRKSAGRPEPTFEARWAKWWALADKLFSDEERNMAVALAVSTVKGGA